MIPTWFIQGALATACVMAAACAIAEVARLLGAQRRGVWIVAMMATVALPWLGRYLPPSTSLGAAFAWAFPESPAPEPAVTLDALLDAMPSEELAARPAAPTPPPFDVWFTAFWIGSSLIAGGALTAFGWRLRRARTQWRMAWVADVPVFVSNDMGPAVVGFRAPAIVVPRWVLDTPMSAQRLITAHETEHLRGHDSYIMALGAVLLVLMPWNPVLWWQFMRLRSAVETDCDARVLAHGVDRRAYGRLLLEAAARTAVFPAVLLTLGSRGSLLKQRILAMTQNSSRYRGVRIYSFALMGGVAGVAACASVAPLATPPSAPSSPIVSLSVRPTSSVGSVESVDSLRKVAVDTEETHFPTGRVSSATSDAHHPDVPRVSRAMNPISRWTAAPASSTRPAIVDSLMLNRVDSVIEVRKGVPTVQRVQRERWAFWRDSTADSLVQSSPDSGRVVQGVAKPIAKLSDLLYSRAPGLVADSTTPKRVRAGGVVVDSARDSVRTVSGKRIRIRGMSTLRDSTPSPLILVDGKVHHGSLDSLDPNTIKAINILKGPTAIKKYGKAAEGGVIDITTKK
jgi:hypothetical protein